jgi:hypothetical protein
LTVSAISRNAYKWRRQMKKLLALAAVGEAGTGLVLLIYPSIVVRLLFAAEIAGVGVVMSPIAGISLIALGIACWPVRVAIGALCGMLTYSSLATLYLIYLGLGGQWAGKLLWPAVAVHAVLTILLARAWFNER